MGAWNTQSHHQAILIYDPELAEAVQDHRTTRAALNTRLASEEARDRWMTAKQKAVRIEEGTKARAFKSFSTEELKRPENIGRVQNPQDTPEDEGDGAGATQSGSRGPLPIGRAGPGEGRGLRQDL